ncbi:MAG TPA: aminotransferase class V-fold PLP-dependent enzyme [Anaerolineae bacterium]|nr:aminotransferase class V-fold PLP-dependent enzyme [Anaerolineae bacterium]
MPENLRSLFLLDPEAIYLNHGSYGACPRPVFETYQQWQRELERQPLEFLDRRITHLMVEARIALAEMLNCAADEIVYFPNPTTAINMVARSLRLGSGDEILSTDHEYGAMDRTWRFICAKTGARYVHHPIPLPVETPEAFIETLWQGFNARTKVVFISHITSPTALTFPVQEICRRAREAGVLNIVDGAHTPGHIPLDLTALGADIYTGACHKWLCAPKGTAFLYTRREMQHLLEPLVVSWGWEANEPSASQYIDHHEWQGTRDPSAFLTVPAAIAFQHQHDWDLVRQRCHQLACQTRERIQALTDLPPICPEDDGWFNQMFAARLPEVDPDALQQRLLEEFHIEVIVRFWNDQPLIRVCFQGYNDTSDAEALIDALRILLPQMSL